MNTWYPSCDKKCMRGFERLSLYTQRSVVLPLHYTKGIAVNCPINRVQKYFIEMYFIYFIKYFINVMNVCSYCRLQKLSSYIKYRSHGCEGNLCLCLLLNLFVVLSPTFSPQKHMELRKSSLRVDCILQFTHYLAHVFLASAYCLICTRHKSFMDAKGFQGNIFYFNEKVMIPEIFAVLP